ncbi:MAG: MraY family glycosyltransferase, partial [Candidatus Poribacteria bacterium]
GGVAIFISFILPILFIVELKKEIAILLIGGMAIFVLGFIDDIYRSRASIKFIVQTIVALGVVYFGLVSRLTPFFLLDAILTVVWIVGLTNALNMLDNMDGLSSGITIIGASGILGLSLINQEIEIALLCLALIGSCSGFLVFNFKPAKIFMGDCGALFLGYMLAMLGIMGEWQQDNQSIRTFLSPILILSLIIFDIILVTILRLKNGKMPWQGGSDHSSHRLVHLLGGKERIAVLIIYGLCALGSILGLVILQINSVITVLIAASWTIIMIVFGIRLSKVECYQKKQPYKIISNENS